MTRTRQGETAQVLLGRGQKIVLGVMALLVIAGAVILPLTQFLQLLMGGVTTFYFLFVGMKVLISRAGMSFTFPELRLPGLDDPTLPTYTILVPLYRETAVLPKLVKALTALRYPAAKLQIMLLLEDDDRPMWNTLATMKLPGYFQVVRVPPSQPRTKPKACDVAMGLKWEDGPRGDVRVRGDRLTIIDGEDLPERDHLLKAVAAMAHARANDPRVACVQAILQFWNPRSGAPSPFYWAEYAVHFRWMLTGMARLGLIPLLGGTSNHFITDALYRVAEKYPQIALTEEGTGRVFRIPSVWDAYNVTEDADLAARLARSGYRIAMVDALTLEEAPHRLSTARRQRSRWLKGFIQTGLVQTRNPLLSMKEMGIRRYLAFNFFALGTPVSLLINPLMWALTALYITARVAQWGETVSFIEAMFPPGIYYVAMMVAVFGNMFLWYQKLVTPLERGQYGLGKWLLLVPLWWMFTCLSAYQAVGELLIPSKRFKWNKTEHGHDQAAAPEQIGQPAPVDAFGFGNGHVPTGAVVTPPVERQ